MGGHRRHTILDTPRVGRVTSLTMQHNYHTEWRATDTGGGVGRTPASDMMPVIVIDIDDDDDDEVIDVGKRTSNSDGIFLLSRSLNDGVWTAVSCGSSSGCG